MSEDTVQKAATALEATPGALLSAIGRNGPVILALSVALALSFPALSDLVRPYLSAGVGITVFGSFLAARYSVERNWFQSYVLAVVLWGALGAPIVAALAIMGVGKTLLGLEPELLTGMTIAALAPPSGAAVTTAAILRLSPRLALVAYLVGTLASPAILPGVAGLFGYRLDVDATETALRVLMLVGGGWLASVAAWQIAPRVPWLLPGQNAAAGVSVLGLAVICISCMGPARRLLAADPVTFSFMLFAAVYVNVLICLLGAALFSALGAKDAVTVGLLSGNRNIGIAVAAAGSALTGAGAAYCGTALLPIFLMPLTVQLAQRTAAMLHPAKPELVAVVTWFPLESPDDKTSTTVTLGNLRVGRSIDADIRILDHAVSREHATLIVGAESVSFVDHQSTNGLFIENERVTNGVLLPGQTLVLGTHGLSVSIMKQSS